MNFIVDELFTLATAMDDASAAEGASPNHDMVASKSKFFAACQTNNNVG